MCIAFWSLNHRSLSLIFASNRDEYLARQTETPCIRTLTSSNGQTAEVLCGLDLEAGGTWLGLSQSGHFAILTNYREQASTKAAGKRPSRGHLVRDVLVEGTDALTKLDLNAYTGFSLLSGQLGGEEARLQIDTNRPSDPSRPGPSVISPRERLGGVSNSGFESLEAPSDRVWPKLTTGSAAFRRVVDELPNEVELGDVDPLVEQLFAVMSTSSPRFDPSKPETVPHTVAVPPLSMPLPQANLFPASTPSASAPKWYGTRSQAVVLVDRAGRALFVAREAWILDERGEPVWSGKETGRWRMSLSVH